MGGRAGSGTSERAEASALVEREAQLEAITVALDQAAFGRGTILLFEGPAGVGKSSLLAEATAQAAGAGLQILEEVLVPGRPASAEAAPVERKAGSASQGALPRQLDPAKQQHVLDKTIAFANERQAFGRPIGKFQALRHKIAEMAVELEKGRALTYHALRLFHEGHDAIREVTMAKLATQRAAYEVADASLQIHGGAGYMKEYEIERVARDLRLGPIGGGTDEIMKEILAKQIGL